MTESEWLVSEDPAMMLRWVTNPSDNADPKHLYPPSDRKLWLWVLACRLGNRQRGPLRGREDNGYVAIDRSDGRECDWDLRRLLDSWSSTDGDSDGDLPIEQRAALLRDIVGNPWRPVTIGPPCRRCRGDGTVIGGAGGQIVGMEPRRRCSACSGRRCRPPAWLTPTVLAVAQAAYDDRISNGTLKAEHLLPLSDALEEADCDDEHVLSHLRRPAVCPHYRGCHVLDLILGKE